MKYTLVEKIVLQGVGFLQGVLLARLLCPEDFGLAAMLGIFLSVGSILAESGLGAAYVVYGGDGRRVLRWNIGVALLVYGVLALLAPVIAAWYGQPILRNLMWVMGLGLVLSAASVVGGARLQRAKRFKALSVVNVISAFAGFVVGAAMAYLGGGVWAIVGVGLTGGVVRLVSLSVVKCTSVDRVSGPNSFGVLLRYGWKATVSGLVHTIYLNAYQLIIGKMISPAAVGLFHRGQRWAVLPVEVVNDSIGRVALPSLATGEVAGRKYLVLNVLLLWPGLAALWVFAPEIVGLVLGESWADCVPYLRILIVGVFFTPVTNVALSYLRAKGRADLILMTDGIKKPIQIAALVSGAFGGIVGLCWAKVASDIVEASVDFFVAWRFRCRSEKMWYNLVKLADRPIGACLRSDHEARLLDQFLEGKSIAVVGNGPSEIGKGLGREIDAHDVVIRFNNFRLAGYELDYGRRVSVWMKGGAEDVKHELSSLGVDCQLDAVLYTEDVVNEGLLERNSMYPARERESSLVDYIDTRERDELIRVLGCRPSSGAFLINRLRRIKGVQVDAYGFAFLDATKGCEDEGFVHYAKDVTPEQAKTMALNANHDVAKEMRWMKSLFEGRRLRA